MRPYLVAVGSVPRSTRSPEPAGVNLEVLRHQVLRSPWDFTGGPVVKILSF